MAEFSDRRYDARVLKEAKCIARAGYNVDLLIYNADLEQDQIKEEDGVKYHEYAFRRRNISFSLYDRVLRVIFAFWILIRINIWILTHRANCYHAHNLFFLWSAVLASKIYHAKVIYDAHELHCDHHDQSSLKGKALNKINEIYERILLPFCQVFIQASDERSIYIAERYQISKPCVINNYAPLRSHKRDKYLLRKKCGLSSEIDILFYSGGIYLNGNRRIDKVIEAIPLIGMNVHFVLIGFMNKSIYTELKLIATKFDVMDRIHILPPCPPELVGIYAASADVGIIPLSGNSMNTQLSALNKVGEYLAAGLPIVCTEYPNLYRILFENPYGPVGSTFNVMSTESIAVAVKDVLFNRKREKFSKNALEVTRRYMNWEQEEIKLRSIYDRLMKK
jgi:glycosyltransferase involved in cell wall biosynthesis